MDEEQERCDRYPDRQQPHSPPRRRNGRCRPRRATVRRPPLRRAGTVPCTHRQDPVKRCRTGRTETPGISLMISPNHSKSHSSQGAKSGQTQALRNLIFFKKNDADSKTPSGRAPVPDAWWRRPAALVTRRYSTGTAAGPGPSPVSTARSRWRGAPVAGCGVGALCARVKEA